MNKVLKDNQVTLVQLALLVDVDLMAQRVQEGKLVRLGLKETGVKLDHKDQLELKVDEESRDHKEQMVGLVIAVLRELRDPLVNRGLTVIQDREVIQGRGVNLGEMELLDVKGSVEIQDHRDQMEPQETPDQRVHVVQMGDQDLMEIKEVQGHLVTQAHKDLPELLGLLVNEDKLAPKAHKGHQDPLAQEELRELMEVMEKTVPLEIQVNKDLLAV